LCCEVHATAIVLDEEMNRILIDSTGQPDHCSFVHPLETVVDRVLDERLEEEFWNFA
jgi:hypothetical protein